MRLSAPPRRPVAAVILAAAFALEAGRGRPADPPPTADKARPVEANKVELHRLKNDDMLKQAVGIYDKAAQDYLAAARAIATAEILLEEAGRPADRPAGIEAAVPRPLGPEGKEPTAEDKARAAGDVAKAGLEAARRQLKQVQSRKELLDRASAGVDAGRSAAVAFLNALDDLKPYTIEIGLRLKDGSLAAGKVPPELSADALEKKRKDVTADQAKRQQKAVDSPKAQAAAARQLEDANKAVLAAEAEVAQAGRVLAQEQKRAQMEKAYAKTGTAGMLANLTRLVEEGDGLKGTYELALSRFNARAAAVARLRNALKAQKQPEGEVPQITRAEDVEVAARSIQELTNFYAARVKALEDLSAGLTVLAAQGGEFEADAAVWSEHLFKINVVGGLLAKAGVTEGKFPDGARSKRLADAADRQGRSAAEVQAATEKARVEIGPVAKQLDEARQAGDAAAKQLANLKQSRGVIAAALKWEEQLKGMTAVQVGQTFGTVKKDFAAKCERLLSGQAEYKKAVARVAETRAKLDVLKDPFLRQAEEQGQAERLKIAAELRKEAGLNRGTSGAPGAPPADPKKAAADRKAESEKKPEADRRTGLEKATDVLAGFQQLLAARVGVLDEREEKTRDLRAALEDLEKRAGDYDTALAEARRLALELAAAATELKKRVGKGELSGDKIPDGVTDALRVERRAQLDADAAGVLTALAQVEQEREKLRRPDPDAEALKAVTRDLLALVGRRLDLLADLKKLTAEYQRDGKDRPPSDLKRLDRLAADRQSSEATTADRLLAIDRSQSARSLEELLGSYYRELIEIEEKGDNLRHQKDGIEQLIELTRKGSEAVTEALPLLEKQVAQLQSAHEEELVLARARLKPDQADELLKAYQSRSSRLLPKPLPVGDKERAETVAQMAGALFERVVQLEAVRRWQEVLAARLAPPGIKAEAGAFQDELARVNASAGANARRVAALTGAEPPEPGQAAPADADKVRVIGGEIGKTRRELARARIEGVKAIGIKIAAILVAALLLPRALLWVVRRAVRAGKDGQDAGLVLSTLGTFVKAGVWVTALALILSVLGFDVTAIVAGLGIGGLAIGLAAQPMIADVIAAVIILAEGKFKIGDVIKLGGDDPAKVTGLSWRSTQVRNADGLVVNIPNRRVTEQAVQNLTRAGETYDMLNVTVTTQREVTTVIAVIRLALEECKYLTADHGMSVREFTHKGETKVVKYRFWWFVRDYEARNEIRDEVFTRISASLSQEELKGTEITLA
jgi:small-conductance mechanosensitive channel